MTLRVSDNRRFLMREDGVFQFRELKREDVFRASKPWREAIQLPGAAQMQLARRLLESRPFLGRVPDPRLLLSVERRPPV